MVDALAKISDDRNKVSLDTSKAKNDAYTEIAKKVCTDYEQALLETAPSGYRTEDMGKMIGDEHDRIERFFSCIQAAVEYYSQFYRNLSLTGPDSRTMLTKILQLTCGSKPASYAGHNIRPYIKLLNEPYHVMSCHVWPSRSNIARGVLDNEVRKRRQPKRVSLGCTTFEHVARISLWAYHIRIKKGVLGTFVWPPI